MLALFGVKDCEALEARLIRGEGPSARRLAASRSDASPRRAAASRADAPRRRPPADQRQFALRPHCRAGRSGLAFAVGSGSRRRKRRGRPRPQRSARLRSRNAAATADLASAPSVPASTPSPNSRFLWTLDEEGRFGAPDPVLVAAVGANAPHRGESLEALLRRVGLDRGDELIRVLGERETFCRVTLEWPLSGLDRRRLVALSAAPMFGRQREFLGYRGFGVLGEEIEATRCPGGLCACELAATIDRGRRATERKRGRAARIPLEFAPTRERASACPSKRTEREAVRRRRCSNRKPRRR